MALTKIKMDGAAAISPTVKKNQKKKAALPS